jgi:hypothetical protein
LKIFTFNDLCASIKESCLSIEQDIVGFDGYHILTIKGKSQEWMASLALRYLPENNLPESFIGIDVAYNDWVSDVKSAKYRNFILFDDALYSGGQMDNTLQNFIGFTFTREGFNKAEPITLYIVVGFMSDRAKNHLDQITEQLKKYHINVKLINKRSFIHAEAELEAEKVSDDLKQKVINLLSNKALVVTEWKTPDYVSSSQYVTRGYIPYHIPTRVLSDMRSPQLAAFDRDLSKGLECQNDGINPINQIEPPYSKKIKF